MKNLHFPRYITAFSSLIASKLLKRACLAALSQNGSHVCDSPITAGLTAIKPPSLRTTVAWSVILLSLQVLLR